MVTGSPSVAIRIYTMEEISEIERSLVETDGDVDSSIFVIHLNIQWYFLCWQGEKIRGISWEGENHL